LGSLAAVSDPQFLYDLSVLVPTTHTNASAGHLVGTSDT
jgi:hypothetical protein